MNKIKLKTSQTPNESLRRSGVSKKHNNGNYRIERFKLDRNSNTAGIIVGCYCYTSSFDTLDAVNRYFNRKWYNDIRLDEMLSEIETILIFDGKITVLENKGGYVSWDIQFRIEEPFGKHLDELVFDLIEGKLFNIIEESDLIVLDK